MATDGQQVTVMVKRDNAVTSERGEITQLCLSDALHGAQMLLWLSYPSQPCLRAYEAILFAPALLARLGVAALGNLPRLIPP